MRKLLSLLIATMAFATTAHAVNHQRATPATPATPATHEAGKPAEPPKATPATPAEPAKPEAKMEEHGDMGKHKGAAKGKKTGHSK